MNFQRRSLIAGAGAAAAGAMLPGAFAQSGAPIRVGGSMALTGPLSSTGLIHKLTGDIYIENLNKRGGLLGRPVEWVLKDDQSKPDLSRTLYEQLITSDKVDLLIGPYGTGSILAAMGVAQRYGKTLVHHTFGVPSLASYDRQFPIWPVGADPEVTTPNLVFDALATNKMPRTVAIVTSKFPSVHFVSLGAREIAKKRGVREVLLLEWDFGNREFGPIAARIKEAQPDFVWTGAIGLEGVQLLDAMKKIDYKPPQHYYQVPSPGPMLKAPEANGAIALTIFEDHPPFTNNPVAAEFVRTFRTRAAQANFTDTAVDAQAAASFSAWQVIEAGVKGARSLDDKAISDWLKANTVDTIEGKLRFNGKNNFGDDLQRIKQVQNGKWVTVWPRDWAAPGARMLVL